ncbi:MAG: sulfite exporter TauE/SafE family protein [Clostridiales bacterium]|nr:sulfite exporter TauE/SafE family protein [Clostridiales bacterium]
MGILYFFIVLVATTAGAIAGVGGGVLIKPTLDALGYYNLATIGILSSIAVLTMAVVSTVRRFISGLKVDKKIVILAIGAIAGGFAGKEIFYRLISVIEEPVIKIIQSVLIVLLMIIILFKDRLTKRCIENFFAVLIAGFVLGTLASFLGIGGGPVNVAVLYILLNMDIKKAAVGSIFIILLAQASKIVTISLSQGFAAYDLKILWYMIPAGITGGFLGSFLHNRINEKTIHAIFNTTVVVVILICLYNIAGIFI